MKVVFPILTLLFLLLSTSFVGGHGVMNFFVAICSFDSFLNTSGSVLMILSLSIYFMGVVILFFSIPLRGAGRSGLIKISVLCSVVSFVCFFLFSLQYYIQYGLFLLTSFPFICFLAKSIYDFRGKRVKF